MRTMIQRPVTCLVAVLWVASCTDEVPRSYVYVPDATAVPNVDAYTIRGQDTMPRAQDGAPPADAGCSLTDVPQTHVYHTAICWAVGRGIMPTPGGLFGPEASVTRAQMARQLLQISYKGNPPAAPTSPYFTDVDSTHPDFGPIQQLAADGVAKGCNVAGTKFCPDMNASNAHGASLSVLLKYKAQPFTLLSTSPYFSDVPATHWAFSTIQKQHEDKASVPCGPGTSYCPDTPTRRGKWAQVLYSYFGP